MTDEHSVRQLVEELSNAALRDLLRNVRHHTELRRRISTGFVDERWVNQAYRDYARREGPSYRQQAADLTLQYYTDLADLGNRYSERFYADMLDDIGAAHQGNGDGGDRGDHRSGDEAPDDVDEVAVELHGPLGREVMARFGVENTEAHPVTLSIEVGACRGPDETVFFAPLTVQPAEFTLEPGASRQITLRLLMLPSAFVPGHLYRLPLVVHGADDIRLALTIWAEERDTGTPLPSVEQPSPTAEPVIEAAVVGDDATASEPQTTTEPTRPSRRPRKRSAKKAPATSPPVAAPERFLVRCPACARDFERSERTTKLYPHQTPDGEACPARKGRVRAA